MPLLFMLLNRYADKPNGRLHGGRPAEGSGGPGEQPRRLPRTDACHRQVHICIPKKINAF